MTLVTALLILAAVLVAAALAVLSSIAAIAEVLPPRPGQVEESPGPTAAAQNRMPTRIGMKSQ
ncbi:MAG TPA: hypothetical protein VEQ16_12055 [Acidocella sp.]|nr:hypothetical protein [Acidocella sp.]